MCVCVGLVGVVSTCVYVCVCWKRGETGGTSKKFTITPNLDHQHIGILYRKMPYSCEPQCPKVAKGPVCRVTYVTLSASSCEWAVVNHLFTTFYPLESTFIADQNGTSFFFQSDFPCKVVWFCMGTIYKFFFRSHVVLIIHVNSEHVGHL